MKRLAEKELYEPISKWLQKFLCTKYRRARIKVVISARRSLARIVDEERIGKLFKPEWRSWDIYVDIVGFIITAKVAHLALVECKYYQLTLRHVSQLIGYSKVCIPEFSFLLSPNGISSSLKRLLTVYERLDVLQYGNTKPPELKRGIILAKWDHLADTIDYGTCICIDEMKMFL